MPASTAPAGRGKSSTAVVAEAPLVSVDTQTGRRERIAPAKHKIVPTVKTQHGE